MLQDLPVAVSRPFLGGGFGALFAELEIDPDKVSKQQSEEDRPDYDPEKVVIAWRIPVDDTVLHVPSLHSLDAALSEVVCDQPSIRRL
jgi:hypothetical protein